MKYTTRILIGLDHTEMDKTLIEYVRYLVDILPLESLIFVNVIPNLHIPSEVLKEFPDLIDKVLNEREQEIRKNVGQYFANNPIDISYVVKADVPTKFIMEYGKKLDVDLIVIGRKRTLPSSSITITRLARRAHCNLLIIPEGTTPSLKTICVPIDFSRYSKITLEHAIEVAIRAKTVSDIVCQHVYSVPIGYTHIGKTYEEFAEIMKTNSEKNFKNMIKKIDTRGTTITPVFSLESKNDILNNICELAIQIKADLIIIGAKGRTATAALFIGTFAEKLIHVIQDIPVFIARPKGQSKGLLDYLKEL